MCESKEAFDGAAHEKGFPMAVTSTDIAQRLGLSQPTVSRILNGTHGYRASAATRRRVVEAAREMGYRPNAVARSLRHRRTNIVGFHTGYEYVNVRNPYVAAVLGGLQRACDAQGLDILLLGIFNGRSIDDIYGELVNGRIDGLFLHTKAEDPLVAQLAASALPVVTISDAMPQLPGVVADDAGGTRQAIDYLWARGHRRIAYLAPQHHLISVERRVQAFQDAMAARGVPDAPLIRIDTEQVDTAMDVLRAGPHPPTAVCCWNDLCAVNLLRVCRKLGIRVPDDLAVIGFDGSLDPRVLAQVVTTVAVPWDTLGAQALGVLGAQMRGETVPQETSVAVHLLPGETA